LAKIKIMKLK